MAELDDKKLLIVGSLKDKSLLKQKVYDNTFQSFGNIKDIILKNLSKELNLSIGGIDSRIRLEYTDRSNSMPRLK